MVKLTPRGVQTHRARRRGFARSHLRSASLQSDTSGRGRGKSSRLRVRWEHGRNRLSGRLSLISCGPGTHLRYRRPRRVATRWLCVGLLIAVRGLYFVGVVGVQAARCWKPSPVTSASSRIDRPRWRRDLNPRTVLAVSRFQGECIRPLCHATADKSTGPMSAGAKSATVQTRPSFAGGASAFSATLIRLQFSPIAAICGRDSLPRKCARTPSPYVSIASRHRGAPLVCDGGQHAPAVVGAGAAAHQALQFQSPDLPGHPARQ